MDTAFTPEDPANVGLVKEEHTNKPDPELARVPVEKFVGRHVMTQYVGTDPHGVERKEHLWVYVEGVEGCEAVVGVIDNEPVLQGVPLYGARVVVQVSAVSRVLPEVVGYGDAVAYTRA